MDILLIIQYYYLFINSFVLTWLTNCDVVTLFMLLINSELRCLLAVAITLCKLNVSYVNSLFATKNIIIMQQNSQISSTFTATKILS